MVNLSDFFVPWGHIRYGQRVLLLSESLCDVIVKVARLQEGQKQTETAQNEWGESEIGSGYLRRSKHTCGWQHKVCKQHAVQKPYMSHTANAAKEPPLVLRVLSGDTERKRIHTGDGEGERETNRRWCEGHDLRLCIVPKPNKTGKMKDDRKQEGKKKGRRWTAMNNALNRCAVCCPHKNSNP